MIKKPASLQIWKILKIFLATQLNYLVAAAVILLMYGMFAKGEISVWRLALLAVFPFLLYGLRCVCRKFKVFFAAHLLLAAVFAAVLCLNAAYTVERVIYPLVLFVYTGLSFYWKGLPGGDYEEEIMHPAIELGILTLCLLWGNQLGDISWNQSFIYLTIGYLCTYFLYYYLENYFTFLKVNKIGQRESQGKQIFRSGAGMVVVYTALGAGILAACTNQALVRKVADAWKALHTAFVFLLLSLLPKGTVAEQIPEEIVSETLEETEQMHQEAAGIGMIGEILSVLLEIAVLFVLAVCLYSMIRMVIGKVKMLFLDKQREQKSQKDSNIQQTEEDLKPQNSLHRKRKPLEGLSVNFRIRRAYIRFIRSKNLRLGESNQAALRNMTARECMSVLMESKNREACQEIAAIYERARYSGEECKAEQLRAMKRAMMEVHKE